SFQVTNTGTVTLSNVSITDPLVTVSGTIASLAPAAVDTATFSATYIITQADVDAGNVTNLATATGTDPSGGTVSDTSDDPTTVTPDDSTVVTFNTNGTIALTKTATFNDANSNGFADAGETITYSFQVTNTGTVTLSNVSITDPLVTVSGTIASLAPAAVDTATFSATYTITQADVDAGNVTNQAQVTGTDPSNNPVTDISDDPTTGVVDDPTLVNLPPFGEIALTKTATFNDGNSNGFADAGETITYSFQVTNTGTVTLTGITITDPLVTVSGTIASLAPAAVDTATFSATYTITQADVDAGNVTNLATATGTDPSGNPVSDTSDDPTTVTPDDSTVVTFNTNGTIALTKTATFNDANSNGFADAGETITYSFEVTNTGTVTLTGITITDPLVTVSGTIASLAPAAVDTATFSATYTITQADVDAGNVTNLATATGTDPSGNPVSDTSDDPTTVTPDDSTVVTFNTNGTIALTKTATFNDVNTNGIAEAGETITYSFQVTNTGTVTLSNVSITDPLVTVSGTIASLAPAAVDTATFSATYTITQADVDAGNVTNLATATGTDPSGGTVTDTSDDPTTVTPDDSTVVTLLQPSGAISLTKKGQFNDLNNNGRAETGETITYTFEISNIGTVDLFNVVLDDQLEGVIITGESIPTLPVGETDSTTFKGTYVLTQEDITRGHILNQATVLSNTAKGQKVSDKSDDPTTPTEKDPTVIHVKACDLIVYDIVSPDGDGSNEELVIEGLDCYTSNKIEIYNRWGIKVFEMENYGINGNVFNGYSDGRATYQRGQKLPTSTYYYILLVIDSNNTVHEQTGPIYIITD
ncbi:gliding motility-associated C-terminal domain-containing protein, partial [Flavobacterium sp. LHD-80]|uniref:DUF7507 domain-containing protein n=1 Tax=Flavobacterium sp. LHD-80 TaxID=3071411 RepID=UPI0027DF6753